jgi:hypothetical protein
MDNFTSESLSRLLQLRLLDTLESIGETVYHCYLKEIKLLIEDGADVNYVGAVHVNSLQVFKERKEELMNKLDELEELLKEAGAEE